MEQKVLPQVLQRNRRRQALPSGKKPWRTTLPLPGRLWRGQAGLGRHARTHKVRVAQEPWYRKTEPTFSDALATVRERIWSETVLKQPHGSRGVSKLTPRLGQMLLRHLAAAA